MSLRSRVAAWLEPELRAPKSIENPSVPISSSTIMDYLGWSSSSGSVTPTSALSVPAVWSAVNFIASTIAVLPLNVYRRGRDGTRDKAENDPLNGLLHNAPNPEWTSYAWRKYALTQTLTSGRSYTYIERSNNGKIRGLWPMNPERTTVVQRDMRKFYEFRQPDNRVVTYEAAEILDLPFMLEADQVSHVVPVSRLGKALGLAVALQEYATRYFGSGGVPPMVLEGPFNSPGAVQRASEDVTNAIRNAAQQGKPILPLPIGHTMKALGFNPEQSQFIEARRFMLEEIARVYNLSPIFLQDLTHGTFSNTEQQDLHVVKHTLTQWVRSFEQEMNLKLFPSANRSRFVEFNMDGLLRGDFRTRMEGFAKAIQNSISTPNEVRQKLNDPPKPGGDELVLQQNMMPLGRLGALDDGN